MQINRNIVVYLIAFFLLFSLSCSKETKKKDNNEIEKMIANEDNNLSKTLYPNSLNKDKPKIAEYEPVTEDISPLKNKTVSLSLRNSPLRDVVYVLANIGHLNVSIEKGVDQNTPITMNLDDVSLENALEMVFSSVDYFYSTEDNILKVRAMETKIFELAVPPVISSYNVDVGGDILGGGGSSGSSSGSSSGGGSTSGTSGGASGSSSSSSSSGSTGSSSSNIAGNIRMSGMINITKSKLWQSIGEGINKLLTIKTKVKTKAQTASQAASAEGNMSALMVNQAAPKGQTPQSHQNPEEDQTPEPSYSIDMLTGVIVVTASKKDLENVERYLNSIRSSLGRQVLIEIKIVEVQLSEENNLGLNWTNLVSGSALGTYISGNNQKLSSASAITNGLTLNLSARFDTILNLLQTQGNVKTLSNPRLSLLNGQSAVLSVGTTESFISQVTYNEDTYTHKITRTPQSQTVLSGMMLGIAPYIDKDDNITLTITPVLSELLSFNQQIFDSVTLNLPNIALREMSTTVKLKNKEMVIIGGLISTKDNVVESGIPILSSIPLIGNLFKSKDVVHQRMELVILIRPVLI